MTWSRLATRAVLQGDRWPSRATSVSVGVVLMVRCLSSRFGGLFAVKNSTAALHSAVLSALDRS